jgi:hypothetical protein
VNNKRKKEGKVKEKRKRYQNLKRGANKEVPNNRIYINHWPFSTQFYLNTQAAMTLHDQLQQD